MTGRVLKIIQDSEAVVQAGAPLIDIGDPADLEVVADLLSTDAVQIKLDAPVRIDGWGGAPMQGRVIRVDPAGFVKVSALGIEEQRVRTTIDFADPPETWSRLGHDYRVIVHVTVWSADDVLRVPVGALFRQGDDWAVFAVKDGRASTTVVNDRPPKRPDGGGLVRSFGRRPRHPASERQDQEGRPGLGAGRRMNEDADVDLVLIEVVVRALTAISPTHRQGSPGIQHQLAWSPAGARNNSWMLASMIRKPTLP